MQESRYFKKTLDKKILRTYICYITKQPKDLKMNRSKYLRSIRLANPELNKRLIRITNANVREYALEFYDRLKNSTTELTSVFAYRYFSMGDVRMEHEQLAEAIDCLIYLGYIKKVSYSFTIKRPTNSHIRKRTRFFKVK